MRHTLSTPDVTLFRAAVVAEWERCALATKRMRGMGRDDLAAQFIIRLQDLVQLRAAIDASAELVLPKVAKPTGGSPVYSNEEKQHT